MLDQITLNQIMLDPTSATVTGDASPHGTSRRQWVPVEEPRVVHALPGRLRVHLPGWTGDGTETIERKLAQAPGVTRVRANMATGNVLILFDPAATDEQTLLALLRLLLMVGAAAPLEGAPVREVATLRSHARRAVLGSALANSPAHDVTCRTARTAHRPLGHPKAELLIKGAGIVAGLSFAETPLGAALATVELLQVVVRLMTQQATA
jgi:hypothetical protein